ncbi:MAG: hypothetical protein J6B75_10100 [Ruminococcus sp.]|nr:hypothetical protein [Ruminococcus sp.]
MKKRELLRYSRRLVKGRRRELLLICMIPVGTELFFRTAEAALYCLMLYFGNIKPMGLFTGESAEQAVISGIFAVLRLLVIPPLWCGLAARLMMFAEGREDSPAFSDMLLSGKFIGRAITATLFGRLIAAAVLFPGILSAACGIGMLSDGADSAELIVATNLIAVGIGFVILWGAVRLSLTAVPFLLWERRELSAVRTVIYALRFMKDRRGLPLTLIFAYLPPVLTVAAAPYFIPEWAAAYAVGISIFIKEDETVDERAYFHSGDRFAENAQKLSPRKLRRIRRIAEKAQKH